MKICMVVMNPFLPDVRVLKEAQALVAANHQVMVLALKTPETSAHEEASGVVIKRLSPTRGWPKSVLAKILKHLGFAVAVFREIRSERPDVVHAHDFPELPVSWLAAKSIKAKIVYDAHEFWTGLDRHFFATRFGKWFVREVEGSLARRADAVITINQTISAKLAEMYGIPRPTVVMNAQPLTQPLRSDKLRSLLNLGANTSIVIYAASFQPHRGLEQLIDSTQYYDEDTVLVMMGPDKMDGHLQSYAEEHGLQSHVRFLAPVPSNEVTDYVASADIGVIASQSTCPNRYYGLGNKIFHYIAAGIPVAVSNQPERKRIVREYGIGVVFDETDPQDIAHKIQQVLGDPHLYAQMRDRVREAHTRELNWDTEAQKLCQLYEELGRE